MRLQIDIRISPDYNNPQEAFGSLQLSETHEITGQNFMEIATILGKFHELMQKIKEQRLEPPPSQYPYRENA